MFISFAWVAKPCMLTFIVAYHDATFYLLHGFQTTHKNDKALHCTKHKHGFLVFSSSFQCLYMSYVSKLS